MVPRSFHVTVRTKTTAENAKPQVLDLTDSEITAPVYDDGVEVGALEVEKDDPLSGRVKITITTEIYNAIGRYAIWRLRGNDLRLPARRATVGQGLSDLFLTSLPYLILSLMSSATMRSMSLCSRRRALPVPRGSKVWRVRRVRRAHKASKASRAIRVYLVLQALPAQRGRQVQQDRRVPRACKASRATRVKRAPQGRKVPKAQPVLQDHRVHSARLAPKEQPVHKVLRACRGHKAPLARSGQRLSIRLGHGAARRLTPRAMSSSTQAAPITRCSPATRITNPTHQQLGGSTSRSSEPSEPLVRRVRPALKDRQERQAQQVRLVRPEPPGRQDHRVRKAIPVTMEPPVLKCPKVFRGRPARLEPLALRARRVNKARQDRKDSKAQRAIHSMWMTMAYRKPRSFISFVILTPRPTG
jgi:hypothetical protein